MLVSSCCLELHNTSKCECITVKVAMNCLSIWFVFIIGYNGLLFVSTPYKISFIARSATGSWSCLCARMPFLFIAMTCEQAI